MFGTLLHLWTTVKIIIYPNSLHLFTVQSLRHPWLNTQSPNIDTPVQCTRVTFVEKSIHSFLNCLLGFLYIGYKSRQGMSQQLWQIFSPFHYTVLYIQKQRSLRLRNGWPPRPLPLSLRLPWRSAIFWEPLVQFSFGGQARQEKLSFE